MEIREFLDAAREYSDLGWAVQEQLDNLLDGGMEAGELNDNAVNLIERFSGNLYNYYGVDCWELSTAINDYRSLEEEEDW